MASDTPTPEVRSGHGMLPHIGQMRCVECGHWSYFANRVTEAGPCLTCQGKKNGSSAGGDQ